MTETFPSIATEPAPACPICGGGGAVALTNCRDYLCGLPGTWTSRECSDCRSLWLDPRPVEAEIPRLYPSNYCCTRSDEVEPLADASTFSGAVKRHLLAHQFGYTELSTAPRTFLEAWVGRVPGLARKAGHAVRFLPKLSQGHLLDVGCGNGAFLQRMRDLGWRVSGIEPDAKAAAIARQRGLDVHVGEVERVDFSPETFDAITFTHVMEHFASPAHVLRHVTPALKGGGHLVSISPNPQSLLRDLFKNHWYGLDPPRHLTLPSREGYWRLLEPLGFTVKTWTSTRLVYWALKESFSIRAFGAVGKRAEDTSLSVASAFVSLMGNLARGRGEEVICHARKL